MKKNKKIFSFFIAILMLILTACGGAKIDPAAAEKGRFVETEVTPTDNPEESLLGLARLEDGTFVTYSTDFTVKYTSADNGKTWQKEDGPGANDERFADSWPSSSVAPDGTVFVFIEKYIETDEGMQSGDKYFLRINTDGTIDEIETTLMATFEEEGKEYYFGTLLAISRDKVFISGNAYSYNEMAVPGEESGAETPTDNSTEESTVPEDDADSSEADDGGGGFYNMGDSTFFAKIFDANTGEELVDVSVEYISNAYLSGEKMYISNDMESTYDVYDVTTGEKKDSFANPFADPSGMSFYNSAIYIDKEDNIYNVGNNSITKAKLGDTSAAPKEIMDTTPYSLGDPNIYVSGMFFFSDEEFIVSVQIGIGNKIIHYKWDSEAVWNQDKSLTVWSLYENSTVRAAITALKVKNPDVYIKYEAAFTNNYGYEEQNTEDVIKDLNTRLLAGEGPDILILDGLNVQNYITQGLLADISKYVDTTDAYETIVKSFKDGNKQYIIPARFKMPVLLGETDKAIGELNSMDDIMAALEAGPSAPLYNENDPEANWRPLAEAERPVLDFESIEEIFSLLWSTSQNDILKDNKINVEELRTLLDYAKRIAEKCNLTTDTNIGGGGSVAMGMGSGDMVSYSGSLFKFMQKRADYGAYILENLLSVMSWQDMTFSPMKPLPNLTGESSWLPSTMVGINDSSTMKDFAGEFIQAILSSEVQSSISNAGLSVTKSGAEGTLAYINKQMEESAKYSGQPYVKITFDFDALAAQLGSPIILDSMVVDVVSQATSDYCTGKLDLEAAVAKIEQEVKNYLAEKQ